MRPRNQTAVPKTKRALLGWLRPVRARKAESIVRFLPSNPTASSERRICDKVTRNSLSGARLG